MWRRLVEEEPGSSGGSRTSQGGDPASRWLRTGFACPVRRTSSRVGLTCATEGLYHRTCLHEQLQLFVGIL